MTRFISRDSVVLIHPCVPDTTPTGVALTKLHDNAPRHVCRTHRETENPFISPLVGRSWWCRSLPQPSAIMIKLPKSPNIPSYLAHLGGDQHQNLLGPRRRVCKSEVN